MNFFIAITPPTSTAQMKQVRVVKWKAGQLNGVVKGATITTLLFTAAIGGFILIKNKIEDREMRQVLRSVAVFTAMTSCMKWSMRPEF